MAKASVCDADNIQSGMIQVQSEKTTLRPIGKPYLDPVSESIQYQSVEWVTPIAITDGAMEE